MKSRITEFKRVLTCLIVDKIDEQFPSPRVNEAGIKISNGIELADPLFNQALPFDLLIGAETFYDLLCVGQIKISVNEPIF